MFLSGGVMILNKIEIRFKRLGTQWSTDNSYNIKNKSIAMTVTYRI